MTEPRTPRLTFTRLVRRLRADDGQGLITVMFAAVLVIGLVIVATTTAAIGAVPARTSADRAAALAAAQGGIQDFLLRVSETCADGTCPGGPPEDEPGAELGDARFAWQVRNRDSYVLDGFIRVESTGTAGTGSREVRRTLLADITAAPQLLDYLYYSTYETLSSTTINARNAPRTIAVERAGSFAYVGAPAAGGIAWDGAEAYESSRYRDSGACDRLWYGADGRWQLGPTSENDMIQWGETGRVEGGAEIERGGECEVMFAPGSEWNGKVYSRDALLISSGTALANDGPMFRDDVHTGWSASAAPPANQNEPWRRFVPDSKPAPESKVPQTSATNIQLPAWSAPAAPTCTYTGPTRVVIEDGVLVITSPHTAAATGDPCYESRAESGERGPDVAGLPSVLEARVPLTRDVTIFVQDAGGEDELMAPRHSYEQRTPENSIFWKRSADGGTAWDEEPFDVRVESAAPEEFWDDPDRDRFFEFVDVDGENADVDALEQLIDALLDGNEADPQDTGIRGADPRADLAELLRTRLDAILEPAGYSEDDAVFRYEVDVAAVDPAPSVTSDQHTVHDADASTDTASVTRDVTASLRTTTNKATATVSLASYTRGEDDELVEDGDPREQFAIEITREIDELGRSEARVEAFPLPGDRTLYPTGGGDIYVEGNLAGNLSLVAEGDIVVTGDIVHGSGDVPSVPAGELAVFESDEALALIAQHDVVVYHPVSCHRASDAAIEKTTAGHCPDDITGLYSQGIQPAFFDQVHPSRQYGNLATNPVQRIDAMIMALGGSFVLSNYDRGVPLGALRVNGAIYQEHRGATGVEWESLSSDGSREKSGYDIRYTYDGSLPHKPFPFVPGGSTQRVGAWSISGVSEQQSEGTG